MTATFQLDGQEFTALNGGPVFTPDTACRYALALSLPRRVGSPGEQVALQHVAALLERFGFAVERQAFRFADTLAVLLPLEILLGQALVLATLWVRAGHPWASLALAGLLVLLLALSSPLNAKARSCSIDPGPDEPAAAWSGLFRRLGPRRSAANLVARLPGSSARQDLPQLVLAAHYDSKSQRLPLAVRMALFALAIGGSAVFAALTGLSLAAPALAAGLPILAGIVIASGALLLALGSGNASPGAIDNASGVGVALHLAERLAAERALSSKLSITILVTGAEELGAIGALAYLRRHGEHLRRRAHAAGLYILNFDGPGVEGRLCLVGRGSLAGLVREACRELGYPLVGGRLPGALLDHEPFTAQGFQAVSLIGIGRASLAVHTPGDTPSRLGLGGFRQAGEVGLRSIEKIAQIE